MKVVSSASLAAHAPELMAAIEKYPIGAAVLAGIVLVALACPVIVTWIKHRKQ